MVSTHLKNISQIGNLPQIEKHLKRGRVPKGSWIVFQPSIFRYELLVSGRVNKQKSSLKSSRLKILKYIETGYLFLGWNYFGTWVFAAIVGISEPRRFRFIRFQDHLRHLVLWKERDPSTRRSGSEKHSPPDGCTVVIFKWWGTTIPHRIHGTGIFTLPKTNIVPENQPSQKESSLPTIHFQVPCLFQGGYLPTWMVDFYDKCG